MDLRDYVAAIRRRALLVLVLVGVGVIGALVATNGMQKNYQTNTRLIVGFQLPKHDTTPSSTTTSQLALTFAQIAGTNQAIGAAEATANRRLVGTHSASVSVDATATGLDPFVSIAVQSSDPERAQAVARAFVQVLPRIARQFSGTPSGTQLTLKTVQPPELPTTPISPKVPLNLFLGGLAGLVLGLGLAFLFEGLDRKVRDTADIEALYGVTLLGAVPPQHRRSQATLLTHPGSSRSEAYRRSWANILLSSTPPRSVMVTSATSGEGKTTFAINLAIAAARTGKRTALVDADLRRSRVCEYLNLQPEKGLTNVLHDRSPLTAALLPIDDGRVDVLPSGPTPANPAEVLGSAQLAGLLNDLATTYDVVIIDTPPVLPVADALLLARQVDAVVVVTKVGKIRQERLGDALAALTKIGGRVVGVVANSASQTRGRAYGYRRSNGLLSLFGLSGESGPKMLIDVSQPTAAGPPPLPVDAAVDERAVSSAGETQSPERHADERQIDGHKADEHPADEHPVDEHAVDEHPVEATVLGEQKPASRPHEAHPFDAETLEPGHARRRPKIATYEFFSGGDEEASNQT